MLYLLAEIWLWMLAAFLLGLLVGWWIWAKYKTRLAPLEAELGSLRHDLDEARIALKRCQGDLVACNDRLKAQPVAAAAPVAAAFAGSGGEPAKLALFLDKPDGVPDDLMLIKGIGPKLNGLLTGMGIFHFRQIAGWSSQDIDTVDAKLEIFKGRIVRDEWVEQARLLAAGLTEEFERRFGTMGENR